MTWIYIVGPFSLGAGLVLAGFRRKDKEPRKRVALISVALILIFSLCMFLSPLGGVIANIGGWLASTTTGGGWKTLVGTAIVCLIAFGLGFLTLGVIRDISKDSTPDRPTYIACMVIWIVAGLTVGAAGGPAAYDEVKREIERISVSAEAGR